MKKQDQELTKKPILLERTTFTLRSNGDKQYKALFMCFCGKKFEAFESNVKYNKTKSCGCYKIEINKILPVTHGLSKHPLYSIWGHIKERCYNSKHKFFNNYGGRGIKISDDWCFNAKAFIEWGILNGWQKGLEIDRIDNNGNYEPNNCRITTRLNNARNKSNTHFVYFDGEKINISMLSEKYNVSYHAIWYRIKKNKPLIKENERDIIKPVTN